jgi:hypothetical protein
MHSYLNNKPLQAMLAGLIVILYLGLSIALELRPEYSLISYVLIGLLFLIIGVSLKVPFKNLRLLIPSRISRSIFAVLLALFLVHLALNIYNIYQHEPLPGWFHQLRLYRFISLSGMFWVQLFSLVGGLYAATQLSTKQLAFSFTQLTLAVLVGIPVLFHTQLAVAHSHQQLIQMSQNLETPFADRFTYKQGGAHYYGWIWPYSQFIIRATPDTAVIVIPPQNNIWKMEGNQAYFRWFMHPRTLISLNDDGTIPPGTTHILIALGECDEGDCGWPKIAIPAERIRSIRLIDRETQRETVLTETNYELDRSAYQWGIIELR